MKSISDLFKTKADNIGNTINSHGGVAGFRVPEYQRNYHWSEDNIKRLLEDCLNGFYFLTQPESKSYTFLGTMILVKETSEPSFDGTSLSIVDGQQRLTTLILLCCVLMEELLSRRGDVNHLQEPTVSWIESEINSICGRLSKCVTGQLPMDGNKSAFPRIVRFTEDNRAFSPSDAEYRSVIAKFLMDFSDSYSQCGTVSIPGPLEDNSEEKQFFQNYKYIREQVELGIYKGDAAADTGSQSDLNHYQVGYEDFRQAGLHGIFEKLDTLPDQAKRDLAINDIASTPDSSGLVRITLFSYYLLKSVVLTRVETDNEDYAFDIFDSLNTTGEPLTAIQTFKPHVINFERKNASAGYSGSESERQFKRIEESLNLIDTGKRQTATRELLVTFALYLEGYKLSHDPANQRAYLRGRYDEVEDSDLKRRIVESLADIAEFRQLYWNRDSIGTLDSIHSNGTSDWLKLCCTFISDMKTSLAVPIMARYWAQYKQDRNEGIFVDAVKAVTAFLALRRSITGDTGRIDSDFRKMMRDLCIGLDGSNSPIGLDDLEAMFKDYLAAPRIEVKNKETWVERARDVPLADYSQPLCRFLLFAASNNARSDRENPGLLRRQGVVRSDELAFLNYSKWLDAKYATVEHVAPESNSAGGWDSKIYQQEHTRHTIGNIILLPQKENSSVGNAPWVKKKIFYRVLVAETEDERNDQFVLATRAGLEFKKQTEDLLKEQGRLDMLDPIANVTTWTASLIQKRARNILELAWDEIAPWLSY